MRIRQLIDKINAKIALKISRRYSLGLSTGRSVFYSLHFSFWPKYVIRLLLVLVSILSIDLKAYKAFYNFLTTRNSAFFSPDHHTLIYIKLSDFLAMLFGYRYFVADDILPLLKKSAILTKKVSINSAENPLISIIIPVYNHLDYTINCLLSISKKVSTRYNFEVIVVDDCSTDETQTFFNTNVNGVNYLRSKENKGFINSCNYGASEAKGDLLCFLNNDIQVCQNWLESMVDTLEKDNVGCVGSKLVYANGLLQEAGGVVYQDSSAANYGKYFNPNHPNYNYSREVDYCSGASLMLRKTEFETLGAFDKTFTPAYYEDTDICFAVRHHLLKKVVYQPLSAVIHFEGISSGTDINNDPVKQFQKINKVKFAEKWINQLRLYPSAGNVEEALKKYPKLIN